MSDARGTKLLLERGGELAALDAALQRAGDGGGSLLLIKGPAGIGKSELLAAAGSRARDHGFEVLAARGGEFERSFGFGIVRQLLAGKLEEADPGERESLLDGPASLATPALMLGSERAAAEPPPATMGDPAAPIQHGLHWLVANLAERASLLLSIDDLQWADPESVRWLLYLGRRLADLPVLVVAAARAGEPGLDPELVAGLEREPTTTVSRPEPLSAKASAELVRGELGPDAEDEFCAAAHRASGGNPFYLRELIEVMRRDEIEPTAESIARLEEVRPEAVSRSVLVRLGRMPQPVTSVSRAVAILGDGVRPGRVAAFAGVEAEDVATAADLLGEGGIFAADEALGFAHPLIRAAIYGEIPPAQRALAHSRAAQVLVEDGALPEEVAVQLLRGEPGMVADGVGALRSAAADAVARGAPDAAVAYLRRAFDEPGAAETRVSLLSELLSAAIRAGDLAAFEGISDDPVEELSSARGDDPYESGPNRAAWLFLNGRFTELNEAVERGIAAFAERGDEKMALQTEFLALSVMDVTPAEAVERLERHAGRLRPGSNEERAWFAMRGWWQQLLGGSAERSVSLVRRGLDGGQLLETIDLGPAFAQGVLVLLRADELDEAEGWIERIVEDARGRGPGYVVSGLGLRSWLAHRRGELQLAELDGRKAVELCREHRVVAALGINLRWLLETLIDQGKPAEAEAELELSGMHGDLPDFWWFWPLRYERARLWIGQGRTDEAIEELRELVGAPWEPIPASDPIASTLALVLHSLEREPEEVQRLLDRELEAAREWGTPRGIGVALRARGLVAGGEEGIDLLGESVEVLRSSPARLELARSLTELGSALRRAKHRVDAREPLREAMDLAHRCGAPSLAEHAREELAATGAKPRRTMLTGVESLTPSELRVATMAAGGKGNREIAQTLFVSVKTVETHLGHVYRKLDIASRKELPAAMRPGPERDPARAVSG